MKFTYEGSFQTGVNSELYKANYELIFKKQTPEESKDDNNLDIPQDTSRG